MGGTRFSSNNRQRRFNTLRFTLCRPIQSLQPILLGVNFHHFKLRIDFHLFKLDHLFINFNSFHHLFLRSTFQIQFHRMCKRLMGKYQFFLQHHVILISS
nr:hypothetical protein 1 [signal crayfish associated picorna-like virus 7]